MEGTIGQQTQSEGETIEIKQIHNIYRDTSIGDKSV